MQTGKIGVTTENIFPIIKKFLYSDHEIFLRELISNAMDATQKLKALASVGDFKGDPGDLTIRISVDAAQKTIRVSDSGIGMTAEEVEKYINQIAFSSANEFLDKYKDKIDAIIGHFGLGFYSSFMVSKKVEIITKSYREGAQAVKWSCDGSPEFTLEDTEKDSRGTEIILYLDDESQEFADEKRIEDLLNKYCKFLPIPIAFGKEKEWKDGKYEDTGKDKIINDTNPAWTRKPVDLKDEDYKAFYRQLYPGVFEEPLFHIHLNVDYPFNLTGILYFPRIKSNLDIQRNKIQLYCNQVYVTDSVEGIVPEFLTLLHGVLDSPDIPLNVSRSYLQSDSNVKKISAHINKKVADKLNEIFKNDRSEFEKKWDDLKLFIEYGSMSDEKFYERMKDVTLFKNTEGSYFTTEEYKTLVQPNQTDKDNKLVFLYATDPKEQYTFIQAAKDKGYDVLLLDGHLDIHYVNHIESKLTDSRFSRVDADVVDKLIRKDTQIESKLSADQQEELRAVFESQLPQGNDHFMVMFEPMSDVETPAIITQSEFMRRMKDMSKLGGGMGFYGDMPNSFNLVVNSNSQLISEISGDKNAKCGAEISKLRAAISKLRDEEKALEATLKEMKEEEIPQADKDKQTDLRNKITAQEDEIDKLLTTYGKENLLVKQIIDLALLANGMLKGEDLTKFVRRSVTLIKQ